MKKFLFWFLSILVVLCVGLYFSLDFLIKQGVERFVPDIVGVPVHLKSVSIRPFAGRFTLTGLEIQNPKGYEAKNIFSLGKVVVDVDMKSLFKKTIIVKNVLIDKPAAAVEVSANGTNIAQLQKNIDKYLGAPKPSKQPSQKAKTGAEKNVIIRNLDIKNAAAYVGAFGTGTEIPLPDINQKNIGEKSKKTLGQTVAEVLSIFSAEAIQGYAKSGVQAGKKLIKDTGSAIEKSVKDLKSLF